MQQVSTNSKKNYNFVIEITSKTRNMEKIYVLRKNEGTGSLSLETVYPSTNELKNSINSLCERKGGTVCYSDLCSNGMQNFANGFCYAPCLSAQYSSETDPLQRNVRFSSYSLQSRIDNYCFVQDINNIRNEANVVAYSHRYGGWTAIDWAFNDDIKFVILTNFGFGMSSYFDSRVEYKGVRLCPFLHYVKYRYQTVGATLAYTFRYNCEYNEWEKCMRDAQKLYNAIVQRHDSAIFERMTEELYSLVSNIQILAEMNVARKRYAFKDSSTSGYCDLTDDDYVLICSDKVAHAIEFVSSIKQLPEQVQPQKHIDSIVNTCQHFKPQLQNKLSAYKEKLVEAEIKLSEREQDLDAFWKRNSLAQKIYDKFKNKEYKSFHYFQYNDEEMAKFCKELVLRLFSASVDNVGELYDQVTKEYFVLQEKISNQKSIVSHLANVISSLERSYKSLEDNLNSLTDSE